MVDLDRLDLADPRLYERGDPHTVFRLLRERAPVFWNREPAGPGFWAVTRYADALTVYRDTDTFSSARGIILGSHRIGGDPAGGKMLALTDPPRHAKIRSLINRGFTPRRVARVEPSLRSVVRTALERALEAGGCDFVVDVAAKVPVAAICDMMGVPRGDWDGMFELTRRAFGADDPEYMTTPSGRATASEAHNEILLYYRDLVDRRRRQPREDLVSVLATADVDGVPLSDEEVLLNCDNLIVGGNETARHASAGALLAFMEHPGEWARLKDDRELLRSAVDEVLRWTSPGMHVLRTTTRDVELHGQPILAGQPVTVWNPSANRDAEAFPGPDRFDVGRSPNRHLALGVGEHYCLGASLARLELYVILDELLDHVAVAEAAGVPQRLRSNLIGGIKHLPVRLTREPRTLAAASD